MQTQQDNTAKTRIKYFDSIRATATMLVFLFHSGYLLSFSSDSIINWGRLVYFSGTVGVNIFFVLSGFLLFYQLYKNDVELNSSGLKIYAKKRILRIIPLYYFSIFFIVLILRHDILLSDGGLKSIIYNMLFSREIKGGGSQGIININPVYWSLVVEVHFYFILPIFYYIFRKYKKISLFLGFAALGILYRLFLVYVIQTPSMQFMRFTPANFDFFAIGMLGAYFYVNKVDWLKYLKSTGVQALSIITLIIFVYYYDLDFLPTASYVLAPLILGGLVVINMLSFLSNEKTVLARILTSAPMLYIAKISFSIYIWHAIVIGKVELLHIANYEKLFLDIIITLVFSSITYYFIEAPFLSLKPGSQKSLWLSLRGKFSKLYPGGSINN